MNRAERQRLVTIAVFLLLLGVTAWSWYEHGWQHVVRELVALLATGLLLVAVITWTSRGE